MTEDDVAKLNKEKFKAKIRNKNILLKSVNINVPPLFLTDYDVHLNDGCIEFVAKDEKYSAWCIPDDFEYSESFYDDDKEVDIIMANHTNIILGRKNRNEYYRNFK